MHLQFHSTLECTFPQHGSRAAAVLKLTIGIVCDAHLIDFGDDGDKQCIEINALFSCGVDVISAVLL